MSAELVTCDHCRRFFTRARGQLGRCPRTFCSMRCSGRARQVPRTVAERKARKSAYDAQYRAQNRRRLLAKKAAYHHATYDAAAARAARKKRARWHVQYCRRYYSVPKNKRAKVAYDLERRAAEYGPYAEAYKVWLWLTAHVRKLVPNKYERLRARGYYERKQSRKEARRSGTLRTA